MLGYHLSLNPEIEVQKFSTATSFLKVLDQNPGAVTLDYSLPDIKGEEVLRRIRSYNTEIPVVVISGQEDISTAISLLNEGAYDYIVKNEDTKDRLWNVIKNIREHVGLKNEISQLKQEVRKRYSIETSLNRTSKALKTVLTMIEKAIKSNITVSISGETGTGKEVVAKSIHYNSKRADQPFVAVNIAAIPNELIESELFGHEKGAFTRAVARRKGKFEEAGGGTIFLDEIGEMDVNMQSKLLRVLQERELTRVGGNTLVKINFRVITATHKNLADETSKGRFREDLYYRLLGLPISIPPLRDRGNDIVLLAKHFVDAYALENELGKMRISKSAQKALFNHSWPGNVRELKAVMEMACVMADRKIISEHDLTFTPVGNMDTLLKTEMTLDEYKKRIISHFMNKYNKDVLGVAARLDIGKSTIYRLIQEKAI